MHKRRAKTQTWSQSAISVRDKEAEIGMADTNDSEESNANTTVESVINSREGDDESEIRMADAEDNAESHADVMPVSNSSAGDEEKMRRRWGSRLCGAKR